SAQEAAAAGPARKRPTAKTRQCRIMLTLLGCLQPRRPPGANTPPERSGPAGVTLLIARGQSIGKRHRPELLGAAGMLAHVSRARRFSAIMPTSPALLPGRKAWQRVTNQSAQPAFSTLGSASRTRFPQAWLCASTTA